MGDGGARYIAAQVFELVVAVALVWGKCRPISARFIWPLSISNGVFFKVLQ